jgi:hypothetical protein
LKLLRAPKVGKSFSADVTGVVIDIELYIKCLGGGGGGRN